MIFVGETLSARSEELVRKSYRDPRTQKALGVTRMALPSALLERQNELDDFLSLKKKKKGEHFLSLSWTSLTSVKEIS